MILCSTTSDMTWRCMVPATTLAECLQKCGSLYDNTPSSFSIWGGEKHIWSPILLIYGWACKKGVKVYHTTEDIHVSHLLPFLKRRLSLSRFLVVFVKGEPHTHPSAKEWRLKKWAWRWRVSKLGLRLTSRTGGWGWWRWWPPHYPRCQPEHGGKPLLKIKDEHFLDIHRGNFKWKYTPLMLAFIPPPPLEWECPCPPWPWLPWEWPWPPWLCSLWEWPWCEWPWSWDEQLLPPWEWAWLKAHIPTRLTSKPPTDTGCTRQQFIKEHKIRHQSSRWNIS